MPFSKHWNSKFCLFPKIGILNLVFFQTLEFLIFPFSKDWSLHFKCLVPNIGILKFAFSKHWNSKFALPTTIHLLSGDSCTIFINGGKRHGTHLVDAPCVFFLRNVWTRMSMTAGEQYQNTRSRILSLCETPESCCQVCLLYFLDLM